jgi:hypothetical protein
VPWSRVRAVLILVVACLLVGREGPVGGHAQTPSTPATASGALQRGLTLMETRGDCAGALPHFDAAAKSTDTSVAARGTFARGQCLERLGRLADARGAYETVVRRFPTHPLAAPARSRIGALGDSGSPASGPPALTMRKLPVADTGPWGSSVNGRYLASRDIDVAWRYDLATGRRERLSPAGSELESPRVFGSLLLSPDAARVAYTWTDDAE